MNRRIIYIPEEITDLQNTITNQEQLIKQINLELANLKRELKK